MQGVRGSNPLTSTNETPVEHSLQTVHPSGSLSNVFGGTDDHIRRSQTVLPQLIATLRSGFFKVPERIPRFASRHQRVPISG
jgi:hypothetical protein